MADIRRNGQVTDSVTLEERVDEAILGDHTDLTVRLDKDLGSNKELFAQLYVALRPSVVSQAYRYLNDRRDVDEVVQETFLRLFLALPELETAGQALAWCRRTVTNQCIDRYRASARRPTLSPLEWMPESAAAVEDEDRLTAAEDAAVVREALARLTPTHRQALLLREVEEKSLPEIAAELGIGEAAVKHVLYRARKALRKILEASETLKITAGLVAMVLLGTGIAVGTGSRQHTTQLDGLQAGLPVLAGPLAPTENDAASLPHRVLAKVTPGPRRVIVRKPTVPVVPAAPSSAAPTRVALAPAKTLTSAVHAAVSGVVKTIAKAPTRTPVAHIAPLSLVVNGIASSPRVDLTRVSANALALNFASASFPSALGLVLSPSSPAATTATITATDGSAAQRLLVWQYLSYTTDDAGRVIFTGLGVGNDDTSPGANVSRFAGLTSSATQRTLVSVHVTLTADLKSIWSASATVVDLDG